MSTPRPISEFLELLRDECRDTTVSLDAPQSSDGEWWLDLHRQKARTSISWSPKWGFGVFTSGDQGYGDRPDEIYAKPAVACARVCQLLGSSGVARTRRPMRLKELRDIVGTSQVDLAAELNVNQAAISRMENRADMHLSSLNEYIAAMGGELELRAKFKDFEARIEPERPVKAKTRNG